MTNIEYIESGILELYIAGALSEQENEAVYNKLLDNSDILDEVLKIEAAVVKLTASVAPSNSNHSFTTVKASLDLDGSNPTPVIPLNQTKTTNWFTYTGWAASILLAGGLIWLLNQNSALQSDIQTAETELTKETINNQLLEDQIAKAHASLEESNTLLSVIRDKDIIAVPLAGQAVYPEAYAKVYWDKKTNNIYLDAQGLPEPPRGKVYQVWSLTLSPLTPTSLGTIDEFSTDDNKVFTITNANASEAFGITLEPAGGSVSPTMEQLYTLGAVASTP